jgi:AraC-like DNA-binding protein
LSQPLKQAAKSLPEPLHPEDFQIWQQSAPSQDLSGSLKQLLRSHLRDGQLAIELAASASGMSVRSFQRRLTAEGLIYSKLVDQVRFEKAIQLLSEPTIAMVEIASDLGYTDPANFTRAFRRWTGVSPRTFRCQQMQSPDSTGTVIQRS